MEEDPGLLDDKNLTGAFPSAELKSFSEQQGQGCLDVTVVGSGLESNRPLGG